MKRNAFTLVELLISIAIIAVLAALIFPVFASARQKAKHRVCQSNQKQIGMALLLYVEDYDEVFPERQDPELLRSWRVMIQPYIKSGAVFRCPSNSNNNLPTSLNPETINDPQELKASYAINTNDANRVGGLCNNSHIDVTHSSVQVPSQMIGFAESTAYYSDMNVTVRPGAFTTENDTGWNGHLFSGHNGMSSFWFIDGHVKALKPLSTLNPSTAFPLPINAIPCLWTLDNSSLTTAASSTGDGTDYDNAFAILNYAQQLGH